MLPSALLTWHANAFMHFVMMMTGYDWCEILDIPISYVNLWMPTNLNFIIVFHLCVRYWSERQSDLSRVGSDEWIDFIPHFFYVPESTLRQSWFGLLFSDCRSSCAYTADVSNISATLAETIATSETINTRTWGRISSCFLFFPIFSSWGCTRYADSTSFFRCACVFCVAEMRHSHIFVSFASNDWCEFKVIEFGKLSPSHAQSN